MCTPNLGVRIPHFYSTACLKFYPVHVHPRFRCCTATLHVHHPGSSTDIPPEADLRCHWHFCSFDVAALPSYALHGPCAAPLTDRDFGTHPQAHCFYVLDTNLHSTLDFALAFAVRGSRTSASRSSLRASCALPHLRTAFTPSPHLHLTWSSLSIWLSTASTLLLDSGSSCSSTSALLQIFLSLILACIPPILHPFLPPCSELTGLGHCLFCYTLSWTLE
jgi:hypothetical protein